MIVPPLVYRVTAGAILLVLLPGLLLAGSAEATDGRTGGIDCHQEDGTLTVNVDDRSGDALSAGTVILYDSDYERTDSTPVSGGQATFSSIAGGTHNIEVYTEGGEFLGAERVCLDGETEITFTPSSPRLEEIAVSDEGDGDRTHERGETLTVSPGVTNADDYALDVKTEIEIDGDTVTRGPLSIESGETKWYGRDHAPSSGGVLSATVRVYAEYGGGWQLTDTGTTEIPVNQVPTATHESPSSRDVSVDAGESVTFTVGATDDDGDLDHVSWAEDGQRQVENPVSGGVASDTWTRTFSDPGTYTVSAAAVDEQGATSDEVSWTVTVEEPKGSLDVAATDAAGQAAADATVVLYDDGWNQIGSKQSDRSGSVSWTDLETGQYNLELYGPNGDFWGATSVGVEADGASTTIRRTAPRVTTVELTDEGDGDGTHVVGETVNIAPEVRNDGAERAVRVQIEIDTNGDGTADERVTRGGRENTVVSSGDTQWYGYDFQPRSAGTKQVRVVTEAYIDGSWVSTDRTEWTATFAVESNTGSVDVTATDSQGNVVDGAAVVLYDSDWNDIETKETGGGGSVSWTDLDTGEYHLELYGPDGDYWGTETVEVGTDGASVTIRRTAPRVTTVELTDETDGDGNHTVGETVNVAPEVRNDGAERPVRVQIEIDTNRDGSADERVTRGGQESTVVSSGSTQWYGYDFQPSSAGTKQVRVVTETYIDGNWVTTDHTDWETSFTVGSNNGSLAVTATDSQGNAVEGASVVLYDGDWNDIGTKETDSEGTVSWSDVDAGEYHLELYGPDGDFWGGKAVTVDNGDIAISLQREEPRLSEVILTGKVSGDEIYIVNESITIAPEIVNEGNERPVRVQIGIDTDGDGTADESVTRGDQQTSITTGGIGRYGYNFTPSKSGTKRIRVMTETYVNGEWVQTDHSEWIKSFTVEHRIVGYDLKTGDYDNFTPSLSSEEFVSSKATLPEGTDWSEVDSIATDDKRENISSIEGLSKEYPWSAVGLLSIGYSYCSAAVIEDNHIITSAHCIYNNETDDWFRAVNAKTTGSPTFEPGKSIESSPIDQVNVTYVQIYKQWIKTGNHSVDIAVLTLNKSVEAETGTFGYESNSPDSERYRRSAHITGYPSSREVDYVDNRFEQWDLIADGEGTEKEWLNDGDCKNLCHDYSTGSLINEDTAKGVSGSPVWQTRSDGRPTIISVHSQIFGLYLNETTSLSDGVGIRITDRKYSDIGQMIQRGNEVDVSPTVRLTASFQSGQTGEKITFEATGSEVTSGSIKSYEWDFDGDGTVDETSSSPTIEHTYSSPGEYEATLTVIDDEGRQQSDQVTITVRNDTVEFRDQAVYAWGYASTLATDEAAADRFFERTDEMNVNTVFLSWGALESTSAAERAAFVERAHENGLQVHALVGTSGNDAVSSAEATVPEILSYNDGRTESAQFDGIHLDVEPADADLGAFLDEYQSMLDGVRTDIESDGATIDSQEMALSSAVGWWWENQAPSKTRDVVEHDALDYIVVMAYYDTEREVRNRLSAVVSNTETPYVVAVETQEFPANTADESVTFYEEGRAAAEDALENIARDPPSDGHLGGALHYYQSSISTWDALEAARTTENAISPGETLTIETDVLFDDAFPQSSHRSTVVVRIDGRGDTYQTEETIVPDNQERERVDINWTAPNDATAGEYEVTVEIYDETVENESREAIASRSKPIRIDSGSAGTITLEQPESESNQSGISDGNGSDSTSENNGSDTVTGEGNDTVSDADNESDADTDGSSGSDQTSGDDATDVTDDELDNDTDSSDETPAEPDPSETDRDDTDSEFETDGETDGRDDGARPESDDRPTREVRIVSTDSDRAFYEFTVSGSVELGALANPVNAEYPDDVEGASASGSVAKRGTDNYTVTGEIGTIQVDGPADVYVDGNLIDTEEVSGETSSESGESDDESAGEPTTKLRVESTDTDRAFYEFTVSGDLEFGDSANPVNAEYPEEIDGRTGSGSVAQGGGDTFWFSGELTDLDIDGPARVLVNGTEVDPSEVASSASGSRESVSDNGETNSVTRVGPNREVTVAPGTTAFFEVAAPDAAPLAGESTYSGMAQACWDVSTDELGEECGQEAVTIGPFHDHFQSHGRDYLKRTFEDEGTYRVRGVLFDGSGTDADRLGAVQWTVNVEPGGNLPPMVELLSPPGDPVEVDGPTSIDFTMRASDSDSDLDRVIWWRSECDDIEGSEALSGPEDTATLTVDVGPMSCGVWPWVIDENGGINESRMWFTIEEESRSEASAVSGRSGLSDLVPEAPSAAVDRVLPLSNHGWATG